MTAELELHRGGRAALPEKLEYAKFLATSGLLPAQYRDRPGNVLYAVEYGETLGITPMAAITGVHVIEGKPSASAALISALVRRAGHRIRTWGDREKAVTEIVRSDDPDFTFRVEWDVEKAREAGLLSKDIWKKYRPAMLKNRSITECARDACQEVLFGLIYTPEELGAEVDGDGVPIITTARSAADWASQPASAEERGVERPAAPDRDWDAEIAAAGLDAERLRALWREAAGLLEVRERIAAASRRLVEMEGAAPGAGQVGGEGGDVVDAEVVDADTPLGVTTEQHKHMHALWAQGGIADRDERLAITGVLIGRTVGSSSDLTGAEAEQVIRALRQADRGTGQLYQACSRWLDMAAAAIEDAQAAAGDEATAGES